MQKTQNDVSIDAIASGFQFSFGEMGSISFCWENLAACGFWVGFAEMGGISSRGGHVRAFTYDYVKTHLEHPAPHDLLSSGGGNKVCFAPTPPDMEASCKIMQQSGYDSRYTFSAKEKDDETQYSYFGARYYDSDLSVWLSVDPLSDKYPSLSPYAYCANNPVMLVDPNGKDIEPTDEVSESSFNNYVNSFGTEKMSGEKLFGLKKNENGQYTSSLKLSEKKFDKRMDKAGVSSEKKEEAMNLYKALQSHRNIQFRSISIGERSSDFFSKGKQINEEEFPEFSTLFQIDKNPIMFDNKDVVCTNGSFNNGKENSFFSGDGYAAYWFTSSQDELHSNIIMIVFMSDNHSISLGALGPAIGEALRENSFSSVKKEIKTRRCLMKLYKKENQ